MTDPRKVTLELSPPAAAFLRGTVRYMNQRKILPPDNAQALQTSAWLEEIEAAIAAGCTASPFVLEEEEAHDHVCREHHVSERGY